MKRLISGTIAFVFFFVMNTVAYADSTKYHGALEFCELYATRLPKAYEMAEIDDEIRISRDLVFGQLSDNLITVSSDGGLLDIDLEDFTVVMLDTVLYDFQKTDDKNGALFARCVTAFSALEYDDIEASFFSLNAKVGIGSGANDAVEESFRIWDEKIVPAFERVITEAVQSGEEVLLYSGNYDYYVVYYSSQGSGASLEQLGMIARAHK